jgi:hypothetical protein
LARQAALLKDDLLDSFDQLLDDPALVDWVRQCLAERSPRSTRTGRTGMSSNLIAYLRNVETFIYLRSLSSALEHAQDRIHRAARIIERLATLCDVLQSQPKKSWSI